jgi:hypothetical protein
MTPEIQICHFAMLTLGMGNDELDKAVVPMQSFPADIRRIMGTRK